MHTAREHLAALLTMLGGTLSAWAFFLFDWLDGHSGFIVSVGAIISTIITLAGAYKANGKKRANQSGIEPDA